MSTITAEQEQAITDYLATHHLPKGLGTEDEACSVGAINLAITGKLTDDIPACMSPVVGKWIIATQDRLDDTTRNSAEWKALLPLAAGTGRDREPERLAIALDAMWDALAWVTPAESYREAWETMLRDRTHPAADAAADAAVYGASYADAAGYAAYAAADAAYAAADAAADAASYAASAADAAANAVSYAASAADAACYGPWAIATLQKLVAAWPDPDTVSDAYFLAA